MANGTGARDGRGRQLPWHKDPQILARMEQVAELAAQGYRTRQIEAILREKHVPHVDHSTIVHDLQRLRTITRERLGTKAVELRAETYDGLQRVLRQAWLSFTSAAKGSRAAADHLKVIVETHRAIAELLGLRAADEAALAAVQQQDGGGIGAFLAALATFEQQTRARLLATASDEDLVPHARNTQALIEAAYREVGRPVPGREEAP